MTRGSGGNLISLSCEPSFDHLNGSFVPYGGRSSPSLANDLWFTHMLNVQRWEVFASACDLWFTHVLNAFVNTNTVTRGSTARANHRAVPLPNRRRPPKVLVCLQKFILCPPFRTHASSFSFYTFSISQCFAQCLAVNNRFSLSKGATTDSASFVRRVWTLWK